MPRRFWAPLLLLLGVAACSNVPSHQSPSNPGDPGVAMAGTGGGPASSPAAIDPGRTTIRRLNRAEYDNTLHDLLGTSEHPGSNLPAEDLSFGFDNIADALNVSPLHVETYLAAAERLIDQATRPDAPASNAILVCDAAAGRDCVGRILQSFGRRAFRRPLDEAQLNRLLALSDIALAQGDSPLVGVQLALKAMLLSPRFLFRVELDPEPKPSSAWAVDGFELASRLSYFLWSSMPDDALLLAAEAGELQSDAAIEQQVSRLLADARAAELTRNFAGQWLYLRAIPRHQPDLVQFPEFSAELGSSMQRSTELFFVDSLSRRAPLEDLITATNIPVDAALAALYGMPAPGSAGFASGVAPAGRQAGVLGHASLLMVTSEPGRTSPVKRGAWVLGNLLCSPPPPPPPGVEGLDQSVPGAGQPLTVRARLERHRADPACAACHRLMDPIGFGLENFDAIGRFRTTDQGQPLDTTGVLPDGTSFSNAEELGRIVASDARFRPCVAQKLASYALGRGVDEASDSALLANLVGQLSATDGSLVSLITALVKSPPFRMRAPESNGAP